MRRAQAANPARSPILLLVWILLLPLACSSPTPAPSLQPAEASRAGVLEPMAPQPGAPLSAAEELRRLLALGHSTRWEASILGQPSTPSGTLPTDGSRPGPSPVELTAVAVAPLLDFAVTDAHLYFLNPQGLHRLTPEQRRLELLPLPGMRERAVRLLAEGDTLYLFTGHPGSLEQLLRLEPRTGKLALLKPPAPIGQLALRQHTLWYELQSPGRALVRYLPALGHLQPLHFPAALGSSALSALGVHQDRVLLGTRDGALWLLDTEQETWQAVLSNGQTGAGAVYEVVPFRRGFAISTRWRGLLYLSQDGTLSTLDAQAELHGLSPDGDHLWGIEQGWLTRFNGLLGARVRYAALPQHALDPQLGSAGSGGIASSSTGTSTSTSTRTSTRSRFDPSLQASRARILVGAGGVWIADAQSLLRLDPEALRLEPLLSAHAPGPGTAPTDREIDAILSQIALTPPIQRRRVYEELLARHLEGYDELFLMGLNEDDPATLEVIVEFFRTHHPERAISPLLDLLMTFQGDKAMREHVAGVLESFGPAVLTEVVARLTDESEDALAGGAGSALEQILVGATHRGGVAQLNAFLEQADRRWLSAYSAADVERPLPPPVNDETFRILARRLEATPLLLGDGLIKVIHRLTRRAELPTSVRDLIPPLLRHLNGPHRREALYALTLIGDHRAASACRRLIPLAPEDRFWALQALIATGEVQALEELTEALSDERPELRAAAAYLARGELAKGAAPRLRQILLDETEGLCLPCVEALGALRDEPSRAVLEARLPRARREEQASILLALAGMGDAALARHLEGWLSLELLGPFRVKRLSLAPGPSQQVLAMGMGIVAAYGGPEGMDWLRTQARGLPAEAQAATQEALLLAETLPVGLHHVLRRGILGRRLPVIWPGVPFARPGDRTLRDRATADASPALLQALLRVTPEAIVQLRPLLFQLVPRRASPGTRVILEEILRYAPNPSDREDAARALSVLADPASIPALTQALDDPYFQAGPFPLYRHPVRHAAARALQHLGKTVRFSADRSYALLL